MIEKRNPLSEAKALVRGIFKGLLPLGEIK